MSTLFSAVSRHSHNLQLAEHVTLHARTRTVTPRSMILSSILMIYSQNLMALPLFSFFPQFAFLYMKRIMKWLKLKVKKAPNLLGSCHVIVDLWETVQIQYSYFPNEHRTRFKLKLYYTQIQEFSFLHFPWSDSAMQPPLKWDKKPFCAETLRALHIHKFLISFFKENLLQKHYKTIFFPFHLCETAHYFHAGSWGARALKSKQSHYGGWATRSHF